MITIGLWIAAGAIGWTVLVSAPIALLLGAAIRRADEQAARAHHRRLHPIP